MYRNIIDNKKFTRFDIVQQLGFNENEKHRYFSKVKQMNFSEKQRKLLFDINSLPTNTKFTNDEEFWKFEEYKQKQIKEEELDEKYNIEPLWNKKIDNICKYEKFFKIRG